MILYEQICFFQRSFIPTMPQDELADIKEALLAGRQLRGFQNENPVVYRKCRVQPKYNSHLWEGIKLAGVVRWML